MTEPKDPDTWECVDCGGHGNVERYIDGATRMMTSKTCGGTDQCGPGALQFFDRPDSTGAISERIHPR